MYGDSECSTRESGQLQEKPEVVVTISSDKPVRIKLGISPNIEVLGMNPKRLVTG
jgi:hypothetical protein